MTEHTQNHERDDIRDVTLDELGSRYPDIEKEVAETTVDFPTDGDTPLSRTAQRLEAFVIGLLAAVAFAGVSWVWASAQDAIVIAPEPTVTIADRDTDDRRKDDNVWPNAP